MSSQTTLKSEKKDLKTVTVTENYKILRKKEILKAFENRMYRLNDNKTAVIDRMVCFKESCEHWRKKGNERRESGVTR